MAETSTCPECGKPLPTDAPEGNCPACLWKSALAARNPAAPASPAAALAGRFGDFELLGRIGGGGMGTVYKAKQISLKREVALKIIRTGQQASDHEIKRFKMEAEAAASLDHPNIVSVYEVGEHEGCHYLSMRLVEGQNLEREMARFRDNPRAIATLLAKVARAVHYAHQNRILHRDLKPSNIILDAAGEPHITDFGLAKRVDQEAGITLSDQLLGTPAYIAPEQLQVSAKRLTTAADIYSLGVIFYKLLTGVVPFHADTPWATLRLALEQEPKRPSAIQPRVGRDLETICLRCLEREPSRRYGSAEALAEELERWLRHEPILARPSSVWTRTGKWARRRPAVAAVIALLIVGTFVSSWQAVRATRARKEAESAAIKTKIIADFLQSTLEGVSPSVALGRDTTMLREILDQTAKRLTTTLTNQPEVEAELRSIIGKVYLDLGKLNEAETMAHEALVMKRRLFGAEHLEVASSLANLAVVLEKQSKLAEAETMHREGLTMRRKLLGGEHPDVAASLANLGDDLRAQGKLAEAEAMQRQALEMRRKLLGDEHLDVASSLHLLGAVLFDRGKPDEAEKVIREALTKRQKRLGVEHPDVASSRANLAATLEKQSKFAEAETMHRETLAMKQKLLGAEHPDVASSLNNLAVVLEKQDKLAEAETIHREALAMRRKLLGDEAREVATSLNNLAIVLGKQRKLGETETVLREALVIQRKLLGSDHPHLAASLYNLAYVLARQGKVDEAKPVFHEGLAMRRKLLGNDHPDVAIWLSTMARLLAEQGKNEEAEKLQVEAAEIQQRLKAK